MGKKENNARNINVHNEDDNKKLIFTLGGIIVLLFIVIIIGVNVLDKEEKEIKKQEQQEEQINDVEEVEEEEDEEENIVSYLTTEKKEKKKEEHLIYRITFNTRGGNDYDSLLFYDNEKTLDENVPIRDGWQFVGWYTDEELNNKFEFGVYLTEDITLYAKWAKLLTFTDGQNFYELLVEENANVDINKVNDEFIVDYDEDNYAKSWQYLNGEVYKKVTNETILNDKNFNLDEAIIINLVLLDKFQITFKFDGNEENNIIVDAIDTEPVDMTLVNDEIAERQIGSHAWTYEIDQEIWTFEKGHAADKNITELTLDILTYKITYKEEVIVSEEETEEETIVEESTQEQQEPTVNEINTEQQEPETNLEIIDEIDYGQNTKINVLVPEEKEGKTFDGWYVNPDVKIEDGYEITEDITVIGKWVDTVEETTEEETTEELEEEEEQQEEQPA